MAWLVSIFLLLLQALAYPPPYPRAGVMKLIENDRVVVWDVTWPKGEAAPMHRHQFDMTGFYYWPGNRIITFPDGTKRPVSTKAGQIQWLLKGVTHLEEGASDDSLRAVMIELKGDGPSGHIAPPAEAPPLAFDTSLLDNDRVTVSAYSRASSETARHYHRMDSVIVFTENHAARAVFVRGGELHNDEAVAPEGTVTVFQLK